MYPKGRDHVDQSGKFSTMPAVLGAPFNRAGVKFIAGYPSNLARGLPRASGIVILTDSASSRRGSAQPSP
jgi:ornithine cyclodeaminase/alanine dehydrogenase-like protein (mu-crystallin family)